MHRQILRLMTVTNQATKEIDKAIDGAVMSRVFAFGMFRKRSAKSLPTCN